MGGNVGGEPEMRYLPDGKAVTNFQVAANVGKVGEEGKEPPAVWVGVSTFDKLAELCNQYLRSGALVLVVGRPKVSGWKDKAGAVKAGLEVVADKVLFLSPKAKGEVDEAKVAEAVSTGAGLAAVAEAIGGQELPEEG